MVSITLKELSDYLPYGVIGFSKYGKIPDLLIGLLIEKDGSIIFTLQNYRTNLFKPLLRPLSDLRKEIKVNGERFVPIEKLPIIGMDVLEIESDIKHCSIEQKNYNKLLEWHFDVFGLIDRGLAIDLNSI